MSTPADQVFNPSSFYQDPSQDLSFINSYGANATNRPGISTNTGFGTNTGLQPANFEGINYKSPGLTQDAATIKWGDMGAYGKLAAVGEGVSAFGTLAQLYLGFKAMGAQKKQFKFQKGAWEKNFAASLKAYDNQVLDNYNKYAQGNQYFGNAYDDKETYTAARSLSGYA